MVLDDEVRASFASAALMGAHVILKKIKGHCSTGDLSLCVHSDTVVGLVMVAKEKHSRAWHAET